MERIVPIDGAIQSTRQQAGFHHILGAFVDHRLVSLRVWKVDGNWSPSLAAILTLVGPKLYLAFGIMARARDRTPLDAMMGTCEGSFGTKFKRYIRSYIKGAALMARSWWGLGRR